jgi:uncharacterized protein YjiK
MMNHFDFSKLCKTYKLTNALSEISGIQAVKKTALMCVEDEHLNIYEFDLKKKKVIATYGNDKKGDAEDIVIVANTAYILLAKQRVIYSYKNYQTSMSNPSRVKLKLDKKYDPEGMCYSKNNGYLLIACKSYPEVKSKKRKVFAFDLKKKKLLKKPFFTINARKLKAYKPGKTFNPSGISIHPETNDIYLLGSKSLKMIIRLDENGSKILGEHKLKESFFSQPEGICFLKNGDLLIASEKNNHCRAKLFKLTAK